MFIVDDILLSPLKGLAFIARKIADQVNMEQTDETTIQQQLLEVQLLYEMDEISEEEYETRTEALIITLTRAREQKRAAQKLHNEETDRGGGLGE